MLNRIQPSCLLWLSLCTTGVALAQAPKPANPPTTAPAALSPKAGPVAGPGWSPEVLDALTALQRNQYNDAQRLARAIGASSDSAAVRRDAAALLAMALVNSSNREEVQTARTSLAALTRETPRLADRPDCRLALGVAAMTLQESATAINELTEAAAGFAARGLARGRAEALARLCRAWSRHNEWTAMTLGYGGPMPTTAEQSSAIRLERVRSAREQLAGVAPPPEYLAEADLALARVLLTRSDAAALAEGEAVLKRVAEHTPIHLPAAEACLILAERAIAADEMDAAAGWVERVRGASLGTLSREAELLAARVASVFVRSEPPPRIDPDTAFDLRVAAGRCEAIELEIRRVGLRSWLESRQGRLLESALPVEGSLAHVQKVEPERGAPRNWNRAVRIPPLPAGGYVVYCRGQSAEGRPVESRRLLVVSRLRAAALVDEERIVVSLLSGDQPATPREAPLFWIEGMFTPLAVPHGPYGHVLAMPSAAAALTSRRWTCLIESGADVAVCGGELAASPTQAGGPRGILLAAGPDGPRIGQTLFVSGLCVAAADAHGQVLPARLKIDVLGSLDDVVGSLEATTNRAGAFAVEFPVTPRMSGEILRFVVRESGRTVPLLVKPPRIRVEPADPPQHELSVSVPRVLPPTGTFVMGQVRSTEPGGAAAGGGALALKHQGSRLPTNDPFVPMYVAAATNARDRLDETGRREFLVPLTLFEFPAGPRVVSSEPSVTNADGRTASGRALTYFGPGKLHGWIVPNRLEVRVGEPVRFEVGWVDPTGLLRGRRPKLEVRGVDPVGDSSQPPLITSPGGWLCEPWIPGRPGTYRATLTLTPAGEEPIEISETIRVGSMPDAEGIEVELKLGERTSEDGTIELALLGRCDRPLQIVLEGTSPIAAAWVAPFRGRATTRVPLPPGRFDVLRAVALAWVNDEARLVTALDLPRQGPPLVLARRESPTATKAVDAETVAELLVRPSENVRVEISLPTRAEGLSGATLIARLATADEPSTSIWRPSLAEDAPAMQARGIALVRGIASTTGDGAFGWRQPSPVPDVLSEGILDWSTLWTSQFEPAGAVAKLSVPIPPAAGRYRLFVVALTPTRRWSFGSIDLVADRGLAMRFDVPRDLMPGDRMAIRGWVENAGSVAIDAGIDLQWGEGLSPIDSDTPAAARTASEFRLEPTEGKQVILPFEASRPGRSTVTIRARGGPTETIGYRVWPEEPAADASGRNAGRLLVRRTVHRLDIKATQEQLDPMAEGRAVITPATARRLPVAAGESLPMNSILLIQEEFDLVAPLAGVVWSQRLPANCVTFAGLDGGLRTLGGLAERGARSLSYRAESLGQGSFTHEYVVVVQRPGTCRFPAPRLRAGEGARDAAVWCELERIVAADGP